MKLKLWQVDAFAERPFQGNPAAVVPLERWLPDATMQAIAGENNLSETAFFVRHADGRYDLRWFTPVAEIDLCGHATLASGWVVLHALCPSLDVVRFETKSGALTVTRADNGQLRLMLPTDPVNALETTSAYRDAIGKALGAPAPEEVHAGRKLLAVWRDADIIRAMKPGDLDAILPHAGCWGLIATAAGPSAAPYDFVSRFFSVGFGIPEDPVTGSAHSALAPFWAERLGKKEMRAYQASPRGGELLCNDDGAVVTLAGRCALYLTGEIEI
jgi:PhzF family phenazine biosynthesis protein